MAQSPQAPHHRLLTSVRNFSIQVLREDQEEEEKEESDVESSVPPEFQVKLHPPINRNVLCERYPKGKASLLVFILNIIVSYTFGATVNGILQDNLLLHILLQNCISRMFYPIAGFIADVYIGRYRMIRIAFLLCFAGYAVLVISFILEGQISCADLIQALHLIAFLLISAGGGAFEATIIPLGVDQLQGASSSEISSYFHFFYFGRNLGIGCGTLMYGLVSFITLKLTHNTLHETDHESYDVFQPLVTITILTVGLVLNLCLSHWYFKNTLWENPVKLVMKVLCYAAVVKRRIPLHRRAFRYGEERKKRIELAKVEYDGIFSAEKVEDVKAFCRICLIIFTLAPTFSSINAVSVLYYIICMPSINASYLYLVQHYFFL